MLALAKVQQGHHGRLLVLRRVALEDLIGEIKVLLGELEREGRVVDGTVSVLHGELSMIALIAVETCERRPRGLG